MLRRFHMMESSAKETFAFLYRLLLGTPCYCRCVVIVIVLRRSIGLQLAAAADSEEELHDIGICWMYFYHGPSRSTGRYYDICHMTIHI